MTHHHKSYTKAHGPCADNVHRAQPSQRERRTLLAGETVPQCSLHIGIHTTAAFEDRDNDS